MCDSPNKLAKSTIKLYILEPLTVPKDRMTIRRFFYSMTPIIQVFDLLFKLKVFMATSCEDEPAKITKITKSSNYFDLLKGCLDSNQSFSRKSKFIRIVFLSWVKPFTPL